MKKHSIYLHYPRFFGDVEKEKGSIISTCNFPFDSLMNQLLMR